MKRIIFAICWLAVGSFLLPASAQSFLVLGDIHYDLLEDHDMEWLRKKPDDLRQVTKEYTQFTERNWPVFCERLKARVESYRPSVKAVLQLGDLSEGLAGSEQKARQMAQSAMKAVDNVGLSVPWIIAKGNHDITGPGAKEAFAEYYVPMFRKQLNRNDITSASYAHQIGDNLFVCCDPWDDNMLEQLEKNLQSSQAKIKFVLIHEPVIPVNERCWHVLRRTPGKRARLLEILARNRAIVLTAHLHLYAVVKRETQYGPIVQIMCNSVARNLEMNASPKVYTKYGSGLAKERPDWEPASLEERVKWLDEEAPYVSYFQQQDLPGYGILTTDADTGEIYFEYYAVMGEKPYNRICLSDLLK